MPDHPELTPRQVRDFVGETPAEQRLAALSKERLVTLVRQMLRREPDLESLLDAVPAPGKLLDEFSSLRALKEEADKAGILSPWRPSK